MLVCVREGKIVMYKDLYLLTEIRKDFCSFIIKCFFSISISLVLFVQVIIRRNCYTRFLKGVSHITHFAAVTDTD